MPQASDPRTSFDGVAEIYGEIRPNYPAVVFNDLFGLLAPRPLILEVGPGTGQATRDLLGRGAVVHAVEIGPAMAARLRAGVPSERLDVTVGDFEQVDIAERSWDAVFAATAYHWISPQAQLDRPAALLKPRGIVAIVDLTQVDSPDDNGFFDAAQPIYDRYGEGRTPPPAPTRDSVCPAISEALGGDPRFVDIEVRSDDWNQTYTASHFRKLMLSYSGTQMMEPAARQGLVEDMEAFIEESFDGWVTRPLVVTLTTASLA
jgi:SAM-dependent methyltransferase